MDHGRTNELATGAGLASRYAAAVESYLGGGGEDALRVACEIGRDALAAGVGALELFAMHREVVHALTDPGRPGHEFARDVTTVFSEALAPFELAHAALDEARFAVTELSGVIQRQAAELGDIGLGLGDARRAGAALRQLTSMVDRDLAELQALKARILQAGQPETAELQDALDQEQLFLVYQPIVELRSETVVGVEALARWRHPSRGIIPPQAFIPIAEQSGLIGPLGSWVVREACAQAAQWHRDARPIGLTINVSPLQLDEEQFIEDLRGALAGASIDPASVTIDVAETALMRDTEAIARQLNRLRALGVRIAVHDFGTGYGSVDFLQQFPVDVVKIDRSIISALAITEDAPALLHALVDVGRTLGLKTAANGVENHAQLLHVQRERCDLGQGFLFGRPVDAEAIQELLNET